MNNKNIKEKCKTETIRRKLYRRINWIKNNPRTEEFYGLATEELFPVFFSGYKLDEFSIPKKEYMIFHSVHGKSYNVKLLKENELPEMFFFARDIKSMGFSLLA